MANKDLSKPWIFVAVTYLHIPILRAALNYYIKAGKVPPSMAESTGLLSYILEGTLENLEHDILGGKDDNR